MRCSPWGISKLKGQWGLELKLKFNIYYKALMVQR
jgi:hypothetical protein